MVKWIAILGVLVCLSGSSVSRSWVNFDNDDDYEFGLDDSDDEPNWRTKYHKGGDSGESDEDYEEPGYGHYQPALSNHGHRNDHFHHGFEHQYHGNHDCNHQEHGRSDGNNNLGSLNVHGNPGHDTRPSPNRGPSQHGPGGSTGNYNQENGYHGGYDHPGQHSGHPPQNGIPGHHYGSHVYSNHNSGSQGHLSQTGSPEYPSQTRTPAITSESPLGVLPQNNQGGSKQDADRDRVVFPDFKNQNQATTTRVVPTATQPSPTVTRTTTDRALLDLVICIRSCPATAEYNPVCGSNNVTYNNPGALQCVMNCGLNVTLARRAPCPRSIPRLTSTMSPISNSVPTVTTIEPVQATMTTIPALNVTPPTDVIPVNKPDTTLIPADVLLSVFGSAPPSRTEEPAKI